MQTRFPFITNLAQEKVAHVNEPQRLHGLIMQLATVEDEKDAQRLLDALDH